MSASKLLSPVKVGDLQLPNRILMAPLTRCRATAKTHVPTELMAEYYAQRASAGLLIAEATMVTAAQSAFYKEPGIYSQEQVAGWKKVTDAVHAEGGRIVLQLCHAGRQSVPQNNGGNECVAPSAKAVEGHKVQGSFVEGGEAVPYSMPRALTKAEMAAVVNDFVQAAKNAVAAGFDGVEVHGANGYLLDQFWRESANERTDEYGGSVENRTRFMLEVVDAVTAVVGAGRTGIRLSPLNSFAGMKTEDPAALLEYTLKQLNERKLAFLHFMRADFFQQQQGQLLPMARKLFTNGALIANMGYMPAEAEAAVEKGELDGVAFGTLFIANPDLPKRIEAGVELAQPDPTTFYTSGPTGYTTYPKATTTTN